MPPFADTARELGFELSAAQLGAFTTFRDLLVKATQRFNLTAVREPAAIERRHFLESLALGRALIECRVMPADGACAAIDIGSGGGIPGLPLKIALPRLYLTLLEANEKRSRFLEETCQALGLSDVTVLAGRAEIFGRLEPYRSGYDLVLARAVAPLPVLVEYALPFLRLGGHLAAPKGSTARAELVAAATALAELGGEVLESGPLYPPQGSPQTLVIIRKARTTPERFPRKPGIARKRSLT